MYQFQLPPENEMPVKLLDTLSDPDTLARAYFADKMQDTMSVCGSCGENVLNHADGCEYFSAQREAEYAKLLDDVDTEIKFYEYITFDKEAL